MTDRICVKDYVVEVDDKKFTFEKGTSFYVPITAYHHDPKYFSDPEKFDPERFSEENKSKIDPDTYLPFGIGPRNCIGSRFALMEVKTIFYYLLHNFSFKVTAKTQIPLKLTNSLVGLKTEKGIWIGLKARE
jgi:cytochrome P450 family 9